MLTNSLTKSLSSDLTIVKILPEYRNFYGLTKIHKPNLAGRPILSGNLQNAFQASLTCSYSLLPKKKRRTLTIQFILFVSLKTHHFQTTQSSLHSMSSCSLRISHRKKGSKSPVCKYYDEHYQPNPPIPTSTLEDLMKLILKVNLFHFNGKHFL